MVWLLYYMGQCYSAIGECPICIQPIYSNLYKAPCCNCAFHKHCYMMWHNNNQSCPWCRFTKPEMKLTNVQIFIIRRLQEIEQDTVVRPSQLAIDIQH